MPSLELKIEGKGTGVKTKLINLEEVAVKLQFPSVYILKFLSYDLGSTSNEKCLTLCGLFDEPQLRRCVDKFIEKYVLCPNCKYPSRVLKFNHENLESICSTCGVRSRVDANHKLTTFIMKHPPKNLSEFNERNN